MWPLIFLASQGSEEEKQEEGMKEEESRTAVLSVR